MKKTLSILFLSLVSIGAFAYGDYYESYNSEPSPWDVLLAIIVLVSAVLYIILFFKIWGMTNNVSELKERYFKNTNPTAVPIITEYYTIKELYGADAAKKRFKEYLLSTYAKELGGKPSKKYIDLLISRLSKSLAPILDDSEISLPELKDYMNYQENHNGGFPIGGKVKLHNNNNIYEIVDVDTMEETVTILSNGYRYKYNFNELELVEG